MRKFLFNNRKENPRMRGLGFRIAVPFLFFVIAGSIALAGLMQKSFQRESRALFTSLAQTNANFIHRSNLAWTERLARDLRSLVDAEVFFRGPGDALVPQPGGDLAAHAEKIRVLTPERGVVLLDNRFEIVAARVDAQRVLILARPLAAEERVLFRPASLFTLAIFWLLTLALAWALTRGIVRPLRLLAARLPHIADHAQPSLPGAERNDEIGQLARAYLDTHAQLTAERERREKAERLALLGRMATGLAHEIHNPLSAIRMHGQLLESARENLAETAQESLPVLLEETAKIESLVNQWMFLARPAPPQTSRTNLAEIVEKVAKTFSVAAAHSRVSIEQKIPRDIFVEADARRMAQALGNIVLNAIQAMPLGGVLRVEASAKEKVAIHFEDTGCGFSENALAHFADLFFSEKEGGMGIGLSVASEIIRAHGGDLRVENRAAGGARVTVALPHAMSAS